MRKRPASESHSDLREFEKLVADALEHLWDSAYLGTHPLAEMRIVKSRVSKKKPSSYLDKGRAIREVIQAAIEVLNPREEEKELSRESRYYTILRKAYLESMDNPAIARALSISERTFYRDRRKSISVIARILSDWERR